MGQEVALATEVIANWKQIALALGGFIVRLLWFWEDPIKWFRVIAGVLFLLGALYMNQQYVPHDYREVSAALIGLFTNNIIKGLFRWWRVNEDALIDKTVKWWNTDNHEQDSRLDR